jgi:chromatin remodeling complex protein RSC6
MDSPVTLDALMKELKALRKEVRKIRTHIEDPTGEKQAERSKNNGFNKPRDVSPELRAFLGLGATEQICRTDVTKRVNVYVTEKGLKDGKFITLDEPLKALLNVPEGVQVSFLNLQKFLGPHYLKDPNAPEKKPRAKKEAPAPVDGSATPSAAPSEPAPPKEKKMRPKVAKQTA